MDKLYNFTKNADDMIELAPGFRFHPTDEELITHYLSPKALDSSFSTIAIGDVDLNKVEPWDLPWKAKFGEKEWYFYYLRDRKYPTGLRTNRSTKSGYWKATGKDKDIFRAKTLIGMKKTLVFYKGRAPRGEKTNWVMHEFRLEGKNGMQNLPKTSKNEWVICRVFKKSSGGQKADISSLIRNRHSNNEDSDNLLPPLIELSSEENNPITSSKEAEGSQSHTTSHGTCCFSIRKEEPKDHFFQEFSSKNHDFLPQFPFTLPKLSTQNVDFVRNFNCPDSLMMQDQSTMNNGPSFKQQDRDNVYNHEVGFNFKSWDDDQEFPIISSTGQVDLDCLWNY